MVDPDAVNEARATAFLKERFGAAVQQVAVLGTGVWSKAFAFRHAGDDLVIRFGALREDFDRDRFAMRFAGPDLPIPRVLEIGEAEGVGVTGRQIGGYYAISERLHGGYIDDVDGAQMRALLPSLFRTLDAMRLADVADTAGYGGWDGAGRGMVATWRAFLLDVANDPPTQRIHGWRARLAERPDALAAFDDGYRRLVSLIEHQPEDRSLIHSDLLHFNVLVTDDRITGVLDWGCGLYGDFLYDVAWFSFWGRWFAAWDGIDFEAEARGYYTRIGLTIPCFRERLLACQLHIALGGLAYQAFAGDWDNLTWTARRTREIMLP
ncbi:MAG: phosphotransferase [Chloroflexi bacterium]|nr:phosphotransferase [Chloroflexota bacterium]